MTATSSPRMLSSRAAGTEKSIPAARIGSATMTVAPSMADWSISGGRRDCSREYTAKPKVLASTKKSPLPVPRKGYSRNGKKLGRPCKRKTVENENAAVSEQTKTEEESVLPVPAETATETVPGPQEPARPESGGDSPVENPAVDEDGFTAAEREEIEKLKMGKEYSMDILYRWRDRMVVSDRVLQEGTPLGVFVPYNRKALEYEKFVLYFCDEISGLPLNKAEAYARSKLPAYKGEKWKVLDSWQIEAAGQAQPELNRILKKIGGDPFVGSYLTPKMVHYHKMPDKIRYAVNVR